MGKKPLREGGPSLVEEDMEEWAKKEGMSLDDIKANISEELSCECDYPKPSKKTKEKLLPESRLKMMAEGWGMDVGEAKHNVCDLLCSTKK